MQAGTVAATVLGAFSVGVVYGAWSAMYGHHQAAGAVGWSPAQSAGTSAASDRTVGANPPAVSAQAHRKADGAIVISGVVAGAPVGDPIVVQRYVHGWQDLRARTSTGTRGDYTVIVRTRRHTDRLRVHDDRTGRSSAPLQPSPGLDR
jgi:hypothetical protein